MSASKCDNSVLVDGLLALCGEKTDGDDDGAPAVVVSYGKNWASGIRKKGLIWVVQEGTVRVHGRDFAKGDVFGVVDALSGECVLNGREKVTGEASLLAISVAGVVSAFKEEKVPAAALPTFGALIQRIASDLRDEMARQKDKHDREVGALQAKASEAERTKLQVQQNTAILGLAHLAYSSENLALSLENARLRNMKEVTVDQIDKLERRSKTASHTVDDLEKKLAALSKEVESLSEKLKSAEKQK